MNTKPWSYLVVVIWGLLTHLMETRVNDLVRSHHKGRIAIVYGYTEASIKFQKPPIVEYRRILHYRSRSIKYPKVAERATAAAADWDVTGNVARK